MFYCCLRRNFLVGEDWGVGDLVVGDRGLVDVDFDIGVGVLYIWVSN